MRATLICDAWRLQRGWSGWRPSDEVQMIGTLALVNRHRGGCPCPRVSKSIPCPTCLKMIKFVKERRYSQRKWMVLQASVQPSPGGGGVPICFISYDQGVRRPVEDTCMGSRIPGARAKFHPIRAKFSSFRLLSQLGAQPSYISRSRSTQPRSCIMR